MRALLTLVATAVASLLAAVLLSPQPAADAAAWAPADTAAIHPGVQAYTEGAQCTSNFVFTDGAGNVYVGYAAHCAGTGAATDTNGCDAASLPLGTRVTFAEGGSLVSEGTAVGHGTLAYSSWLTMQQRGESDANTCAYNDLALVEVDPADVSKVNPSVPFWGGPTGIDTAGTATGDTVYSYGNSSLRGRHHGALAQAGPQPGHRQRGLEPPGLHPEPGRARRLRQRVPRRGRPGARRPLDAGPRAAGRLQRCGRPRPRAVLRPGPRRDRRPRAGARHGAVLAASSDGRAAEPDPGRKPRTPGHRLGMVPGGPRPRNRSGPSSVHGADRRPLAVLPGL